ncbi:MAG: hypothetical protein FWE10_06455 [Rikenellaceae bacterium]|nr:hypothetical protein [Rikenellaceae bacterium]MCL2691816.1 hypothetical protein [Rikenellaceae bacterium]
MDKNLKFLQTMSIDDFKAAKGVDKIELLQSDISGKSFFAYGFEKGACSHKVLTGELTNPVISQVCSAETGETFYLLHQKGEGGATLLGTL